MKPIRRLFTRKKARAGKRVKVIKAPQPDHGLHILVVPKDSTPVQKVKSGADTVAKVILDSPFPTSNEPTPGQGPKAGVDIVAIHGLNGHYLTTWTDEKSGVNWLADILPNVAPASRIMSFSYNSVLQFSKSASDVFTFAHQLLEGILAERNTDEEKQRPIVFICHSLGGLVFKRAYLLADENPDYASLLKKMRGVMFFGTPHRGSSMASWATVAARLLAAASLGTSTNTQLAKDLGPDSEKLRCISEAFQYRALRDKLPIVSGYETNKLAFMGTLVGLLFSSGPVICRV